MFFTSILKLHTTACLLKFTQYLTRCNIFIYTYHSALFYDVETVPIIYEMYMYTKGGAADVLFGHWYPLPCCV